jgi:hypothetical protein
VRGRRRRGGDAGRQGVQHRPVSPPGAPLFVGHLSTNQSIPNGSGYTIVVPTVAASTDLVVHLGIDVQGVRRVNEVVAVPGRVENDIIETEPPFRRTRDRLPSAGLAQERVDVDARPFEALES